MRSNQSVANPLADLPEAMASLAPHVFKPPSQAELSAFDRALDRISRASIRRDQEESKRYAMNATVAHYNGIPTATWPERQDILSFCLDKFIEHQALPVIAPQDWFVEIAGVKYAFHLDGDPDERPRLFAVWSHLIPVCGECENDMVDGHKRCPLDFNDNAEPVTVVCQECGHGYEVRR